ncbi:phosphoethanolamine transferase [Oceanisphaera sp. KMM 10153]|uniref:phosphoethanolamine transferase n=1 Tax=Oceanisphaera submarina TaxID=3390193 RepID=UPI003974B698
MASLTEHSNTPTTRRKAAKSGLSLTPVRFVFFVSCYFFLVLNLALLARLGTIIGSLDQVRLGFVLTIPLFFVACFNAIFSLFTVFRCEKPVIVTFILVSSLLSYAMYNYGTIVDRDMIVNILETNSGEAKSYLNLSAALWFVLTGVLPAALVLKLNIRRSSVIGELLMKLASIMVSVLVVLVIAAFYYKDYASVGRNNAYLNKMIIPTHFAHSLYGYVNETYFKEDIPYRTLGEDARLIGATQDGRKKLLVLMVGETARAANFQYGGYERDTNAFTQPLGVTYFRQVSSCGTATAVSVPCMFSRLSHRDFSDTLADNQDNLMDIVQRAGIDTLWLENDGGCKGVCGHIKTIEFKPDAANPVCDGDYCQDQVLLDGLSARLDRLSEQNNIIVLHMVGRHGPTYYKRYPAGFSHFQPDCQRSDIQNCDARQLNNTYDNTLYYSDYIMSEVIKLLKQHQDISTGMLYVSDHGESLGESGLYLHGMPYSLAPTEQTHVPMLTWFSDTFAADKQLDEQCLGQAAHAKAYSHDNLFDSILGLMDVSTDLYRPELDIFNACRHQGRLALNQASSK